MMVAAVSPAAGLRSKDYALVGRDSLCVDGSHCSLSALGAYVVCLNACRNDGSKGCAECSDAAYTIDVVGIVEGDGVGIGYFFESES